MLQFVAILSKHPDIEEVQIDLQTNERVKTGNKIKIYKIYQYTYIFQNLFKICNTQLCDNSMQVVLQCTDVCRVNKNCLKTNNWASGEVQRFHIGEIILNLFFQNLLNYGIIDAV